MIGDLALADMSQPVGTALAITGGNLADVIVIAVLMRRLIGRRADLDRLEHVSGVLVAIAAGASITVTVAVVSMRAGGILQADDVPALWRSWSLADASGSLVVIPLALACMQPRSPAWRGRGALERVATVVVEPRTERQRIARDLHDSVSQSPFSTALHVRSAECALADEGVELGRVKQLTGAALAEMRALVFRVAAESAGRGRARGRLEKHASAISAREELPIVVDGPHERLPVEPEAKEQLYRVTQEALANVIKHASASAARITVSAADEIVEITISDDGRGFHPDPGLREGFGLRSMRARVAELGGGLEIVSSPLRGTLVRARVRARFGAR